MKPFIPTVKPYIMKVSSEKLKEIIVDNGIVDTHYHVGPEIIPRKYNVATLSQAVKEVNATIVLKNHTYATTPLAALGRHEYQANLIGSIVLNNFVGGLNTEAIRSAISGNKADVTADHNRDDPTFVAWMPTVHAQSHLDHLGFDFDPRWSGCCQHHPAPSEENATGEAVTNNPVLAFDKKLKPLPQLIAMLETLAQNNIILATGHLSAKEIMQLVPLALEMGVPSIILTHPHYPAVSLNDQQLKQLTRSDKVFVEHCFAIHTIEDVPLSEFVDSIKITGPEQILCSTDFGQIFSDPFPDGTFRFAAELYTQLDGYLSVEAFTDMFSNTGKRALLLT